MFTPDMGFGFVGGVLMTLLAFIIAWFVLFLRGDGKDRDDK